MNLKDLALEALITLVIMFAWSMHIVYNYLIETQERYQSYLENSRIEATYSGNRQYQTETIACPDGRLN